MSRLGSLLKNAKCRGQTPRLCGGPEPIPQAIVVGIKGSGPATGGV
jgi:hypothetical protein